MSPESREELGDTIRAAAEAEHQVALADREAHQKEQAKKRKSHKDDGGPSPFLLPRAKECLRLNVVGDAQRLMEREGRRYIYDDSRGWFAFNGSYYGPDEACDHQAAVLYGLAQDYEDAAKRQLRQIQEGAKRALDKGEIERKGDYLKLPNKGFGEQKIKDALDGRAAKLREPGRMKKVLEVACAGRESLRADKKAWNRAPTLLACANGVIDLETGKLHPGDPQQQINRASPYAFPGLLAESDIWNDMLLKVFCRDLELIDYFERAVGYAATGLMSHKNLFIAYGPHGDNGKSALYKAIQRAFGSYAASVDVGLLTEDLSQRRRSGGPDEELLSLDQLRLAVFGEPKKGSFFASTTIKTLTGSDVISVRGLYSKPVQFTPSSKIFIHTNHMPNMKKGLDGPLIKRLRIIPHSAIFASKTTKIPKDFPPENLHQALPMDVADRLFEEAGPAILAWVVRCARRFLRDGCLEAPKVVMDQVAEYEQGQDTVGEFVEECCDVADGQTVTGGDLYQAYTQWCEKVHRSKPLGTRNFGEDMSSRFSKKRGNRVVYQGVGLNDEWRRRIDPTYGRSDGQRDLE